MRGLWLITISLLLSGCGGGDTDDDADVISATVAGRLLLDSSHGDGGTAWGLEACDSCHALAVIHSDAPASTQQLVQQKGYSTCTGCHGDNGTSLTRPCLVCHNTQDLPADPHQDGGQAHHFSGGTLGALTDDECLTCHFGSDMDGVFDSNSDLTRFADAAGFLVPYTTETDFCLRCHNRDHQQPGFDIVGSSFDDPLIALEDDYQVFDYHGWRDGSGEGTYAGLRDGYLYPDLVDCSDCHAMHGTINDKLIIDSSIKGVHRLSNAIRLSAFPVTVGANGDYSQLCVLCHDMDIPLDDAAVDSGNGLNGVHMVGEDCRPCHTHGEAVQVGL
ncbi:MAG: hypothetical protein DIZ77_04255 [endosymbiont of Seepiophila jonesi]|uniref:Uncharacterized protein n=1 Tax=endosymbiont of Lamellibrachia luymesi TaxID=2200907 RepID=A0A370DNN5_9GAMM|nr:MAG: hypothetical protein DIZ79_16095 [endosymbiont of Lamellibrachia luymesi]RDH93868.1 MAG: hypothetical protein DIZ77_04255 [endosymbiont of Seepiophila jonesi]